MNKVKFSVLLSIYYKEKPEYFRECMESIYSQTVLPDEIVLVEDGRLTDELYEAISEYECRASEINFVTVKLEKNSGLGLALAEGIKHCSNELVARVGALLRRSAMTESAQKQPQSAAYDVTSADHVGTFVEYDGLVVNISNYTVTFEGHNLEMPPKELEILYFLASRPNQVFTREQLLDKLWGYEYVGDTRTVDVHIKRLREKLNNNHNWSIATVWGIGYKFEWRS